MPKKKRPRPRAGRAGRPKGPTASRKNKTPPLPARRATPDVAVLADIGASTFAGQGLSRANWTDQQIAVLTAPFTEHELEILDDGSVYIPHVHVRTRLHRAFRVGQWGIAVGEPKEIDGKPVIRIRLYINGAAVAEAYADRDKGLESAKSQGLVRCCKDLEMAPGCWNQRWSYNFRLKHGVLVTVSEGPAAWRNVLSPPVDGETGVDPRSPNKTRYKLPTAAQRVSAGARPSMSRRTADRAAAVDLQHETEASSAVDLGLPIGKVAIGQLMGAARKHKRTDSQIKAFIKRKWKLKSKKDILFGHFDTLMDWVKAPGK